MVASSGKPGAVEALGRHCSRTRSTASTSGRSPTRSAERPVSCWRARRADVIDAALVLLASDGDRVITSDPDDLAPLARAADLDVEIVTP
jgi:hypothetical protein